MNLQTFLERARNGGGILFCGTGYSADCLNFHDVEEIGTSQVLLDLLNEKLRQRGHTNGFKGLKNAADEYREKESEYSLMLLLKDRFKISNVTDDMIDIATFSWDRIYTTNYDNAIEHAFTRANRPFRSINNLEHSGDIPGSGVEIIHLHGCAEKWNIENFGRSCILGTESYLRTDEIRHWLSDLRNDVERANIVAFVGFSSEDFHLNQVLFNASSTKSKVFFINNKNAQGDPDVERTQKTFGTPICIGRLDFAKIIREVTRTELPKEPVLRCYQRYERSVPSTEVPSVTAIEDLFIFGEFERSHLVRDVTQRKRDYHVSRTITQEILGGIEEGEAIVLITGEICDGKTLVVEGLCAQLSLGRPILILRHAYDDILKETVSILNAYENVVVIIENCFDLSRERLTGLAHQFEKSQATLILTSRSIAAEAETADAQYLEEFQTFREFRFSRLDKEEVDELIDLTDQIAAWRAFWGRTRADRRRFVLTTCDGSLPGFLLRLLRSEHVRSRYAAEYRKTESLNPTGMRTIIAALYVAHIGHDAPLAFLSHVFRYDVGDMIDRLNRQSTAFKLIRRHGERVKTVPSIGATNILKEIVEPRDVVDTIVKVLERLREYVRYDDFSHHIFTQMMRYSILASVVDDSTQIDRFFDNVSKIEYCRRRVLFWLQWHMAKTDQKIFSDAEKYLQQGYKEAESYEQRTGRIYDRRQLDDRRAKFLMIRGRHEVRARDTCFRDFYEACRINGRLLRLQELTHHPYDTLCDISRFLEARRYEFDEAQLNTAVNMLQNLILLAETQVKKLKDGYQARRAQKSLRELTQVRNIVG